MERRTRLRHPQAYFVDITDAISIRIDKKAIPDIVAEASSLTPRSLSIFRSFLSPIPCIRITFAYADEGKRHSRRFVFTFIIPLQLRG